MSSISPLALAGGAELGAQTSGVVASGEQVRTAGRGEGRGNGRRARRQTLFKLGHGTLQAARSQVEGAGFARGHRRVPIMRCNI